MSVFRTLNLDRPDARAKPSAEISYEAGFDRDKLIQPEIMVPPLLWLVSDAAAKVTGRRFLGFHWDAALPPDKAAERAGAPVAWTSIATMPITPSQS